MPQQLIRAQETQSRSPAPTDLDLALESHSCREDEQEDGGTGRDKAYVRA